jgi:hypothetical protein
VNFVFSDQFFSCPHQNPLSGDTARFLTIHFEFIIRESKKNFSPGGGFESLECQAADYEAAVFNPIPIA